MFTLTASTLFVNLLVIAIIISTVVVLTVHALYTAWGVIATLTAERDARISAEETAALCVKAYRQGIKDSADTYRELNSLQGTDKVIIHLRKLYGDASIDALIESEARSMAKHTPVVQATPEPEYMPISDEDDAYYSSQYAEYA